MKFKAGFEKFQFTQIAKTSSLKCPFVHVMNRDRIEDYQAKFVFLLQFKYYFVMFLLDYKAKTLLNKTTHIYHIEKF